MCDRFSAHVSGKILRGHSLSRYSGRFRNVFYQVIKNRSKHGFPLSAGKRSTAPGGEKAVQTLGHHASVSALISMQVFWNKPSVFISEFWFSKYKNGKSLLQVKCLLQPKTSGHKCLKQETITHMVTQ